VRLMARAFRPGARAQAVIELSGGAPATLPVEISLAADDGRQLRVERIVTVERKSVR
jgi:hypothetical protein